MMKTVVHISHSLLPTMSELRGWPNAVGEELRRRLVGCLWLPILHSGKSQASLASLPTSVPRLASFGWRRVMTPDTPPTQGLPNATPSMERLEAILSCGPRLRIQPDGSGKPGGVDY